MAGWVGGRGLARRGVFTQVEGVGYGRGHENIKGRREAVADVYGET